MSFGFACSDIDECLVYSCYNDGICNEVENGFNCTCVAGFTGALCETGTFNLTLLPYSSFFIQIQFKQGEKT